MSGNVVAASAASISRDLALLVNPGLDAAFPRLAVLPTLQCVQARLRSTNDGAHRQAIRRMVEDAFDELRRTSPEYAKAAKALLVLGPRTSTADARRRAAGDALGKSGQTFKRHHETRVLRSLADAILLVDASTPTVDSATGSRVIDVGWQTIQSTLHTMHREIEHEFEPDVVVTMSGPGSFAAFMCLAMDPRDVPVIACTTFPNRERPSSTHQVFAAASKGGTWKVVETQKWLVYLPTTLAEFPSKSRMLIFDDRVVSGHTQREVRSILEEAGYEVRSAAMIVSSASSELVDFHGVVIDDDYALPWGTRRGRT
jgi:adenine/guanine phosphoribosyltransferase-like PRPP-binding protein